MIIRAAITHNDFKKIYANIVKNRLQLLATPTSITTDDMVLKFSSRHYATINPFTIEDAIWRPGGITHLSITL